MARPSIREQLLNLPNLLTYGRVLIIPVVLYFLAEGSPRSCFFAAFFFALAAVTDVIDGYLARKWNLTTVIGKFLDPLADKILVMACLVVMVPMGRIPAWMVIVLLTREMSVTSLRSIASSEGLVIAAGSEGKIKTALQVMGILFLLIHFRYPAELIFVRPFIRYQVIGYWLVMTSLAFSVFSALDYFRMFYQASEAARERRTAAGE
jgi:CDP-diacylglycerol--glycerol-3-phosphate 3-phosphatidyltransferase